MSGINKVLLIGNVGRDPEIRNMPNGDPVANLSLATSFKSKGTEYTEWHKLVAFGKTADLIKQYVHKGSKLYVEGRLQTRSWEKDGSKHYSTEIVIGQMQFLGGKGEQGASAPAPHRQEPDFGAPPPEDFDDDIPF